MKKGLSLLSLFFLASCNYDVATSVVPGWHTTILSPWQTAVVIFFGIIVLAAVIVFIVYLSRKKNR